MPPRSNISVLEYLRQRGVLVARRQAADAPAPPPGYDALYPDTDGTWRTRPSSGTASDIGGGGASPYRGFWVTIASLEIPDASGGEQIVPLDLAGNYAAKSDDVTVDGTFLVLPVDGMYAVSFQFRFEENVTVSPTWILGLSPAVGLNVGNWPAVGTGNKPNGNYAYSGVEPFYAGNVGLSFTNHSGGGAMTLQNISLHVTYQAPLAPGW